MSTFPTPLAVRPVPFALPRYREAEALGVCRALVFAYAVWHYARIDFTVWADLDAVFWKPMLVFRLLPLDQPSHIQMLASQWVWRASLVLCCVGLFTRIATPVAAIGAWYLLGMPNNFGKVHHSEAAFVVALTILALSRCGDAWSLDSRIRGAGPTASWRHEYVWPVIAIRTLLALSLFAAGLSKLRHAGVAWMGADSFSLLLSEYIRLEGRPLFPALGLWLAQNPLSSPAIATATLLTELLNPIALISRHARYVLIPGTLLMLFGIHALMGPIFYPMMVLHIVWVNWSWVLEKAGLARALLHSQI